MNVRLYLAAALLLFAVTARADEIYLKDGSKIVGTIVGYEATSFKIQTTYGFALVEKDKISKIVPSNTSPSMAGPRPKLEDNSTPEAKKNSAAAATQASVKPRIVASRISPSEPIPPKLSGRLNTKPPALDAALSQPLALPPPKETALPAMREEVRGNRYINYTFGFEIFKAPGWNIMEAERNSLPNAIVALGTSDETTLLVIGRERTKESVETRAGVTEKQLREVYENYRRISEWKAHVGGVPAIEQHYRGTSGGREWSGVVVTLARGDEIFTILGVTTADSDLIQIQENVISRAIASLNFNVR